MAFVMSSNQVNVSQLYSEAKKLFRANLFRSVESLCLLCISHLSKSDTRSVSNSVSVPQSELYELLADAIFEQKQVRRALSYYRLAMQCKSPFGVKVTSRLPANWVHSSMDAELLFKVAKCQYELGDASAAIQDLSSIPSTFLDVSMLTTLAHWYKGVNRITEAIQLYKQAYQLAPYALELLEIIFSLKADDVEIQKMLKTYHTAPHSDSVSSSEVTSGSESTATSTQGELKSPVPKLNVNPPDWMQNLITGIHRHYKYESEKALENFQRLNPIFPKNVYLMRLTAQAWVHHEVEEQAISLYRQIQRCDAHYIQDMDRFSVLLYKKSVKQTTDNDDEALQLLSNNLMDSSQASAPEALTSVAYYCLLKSEFETALTFADRAIAASKGQHAEAWRCRGAIRSKSDSYDLSAVLTDYIRANALEKDIASFVGLIETNIEMKKYRDAAIAGKEMVLLYPKSARALFTLGTIMSKSPQGERETIKAYCKALRLNPCLLDATLALCARYLALGNNEDAENW